MRNTSPLRKKPDSPLGLWFVRRAALWLGLLSLAQLPLCAQAPFASEVERFNYILGTQTIGPKYHFTREHPLMETAGIIHEMGSTVLKFALHKSWQRGADSPSQIRSLLELARDEPSHRKALDMPFAHVVLWAHPLHGVGWHEGFPLKAQEQEYREMYELTAHLLKTYGGSERTFYLGHWEGDGMLRHSVEKKDDTRATLSAIQGMIDWLTVRQRAVDDAKRDTPHAGVQVWHYTEVNHVVIARDEGRPTVVNRVLPHVPVDFVSYSAYDTTNEPNPSEIRSALDYIEARLAPKPHLAGKRVWIGEYGFPTRDGPALRFSPVEQDARSRIVMRTALEWGCPFALYWELYNNEVGSDGSQSGFWMIDSENVRQPVFETHRGYYAWARQFVAETFAKTARPPSDRTFRKAAVAFFDQLPPAAGR